MSFRAGRFWPSVGLAAALLVGLACESGRSPGEPADLPRDDLPAAMAALGDSITAGVGACVTLAGCARNSWSTGNGLRVESHYRRLRSDQPGLDADNLAVPGARAAGLIAQAGRIPDTVDYVTVLVGANDACRGGIDEMTPVDAFREAVDGGLAAVERAAPRAQVMVVSLPDLYRLWEIGHGDDRVVRAWDHGVCPALLAGARSVEPSDVARRAEFRDRIADYNRQLAAACRAYGSRCHWDGGAVHKVRFGLDMLNRLDYFHPDSGGQDALAAATWPKSPYAQS